MSNVTPENARMRQILGTTAEWAAKPTAVLRSGEIGVEVLVSGKKSVKINLWGFPVWRAFSLSWGVFWVIPILYKSVLSIFIK